DAILNMRLRSLRKLEEFEIRTEDKNLRGELKGIKSLLGSETEQWSKVGEQVRKVRDLFGPKTPLGKRRTMFADAPEHDLAAIESLVVNKGERKFLIASSEGQGFVVKEEDCVGNTRKGKQVLNVTMPNEACAIATVQGDTVAAIGTNHKMVLFPIDQVPEMAR